MWRGFSWKFHVILRHKSTAVWSKSTPNSMTIPCPLSMFYLFSMLEHDTDFGQVQVMKFPWHLLRKWWDFPSGFGLIPEPNQTAVKKTKDMRKSLSYFLQGTFIIVNSKYSIYVNCKRILYKLFIVDFRKKLNWYVTWNI